MGFSARRLKLRLFAEGVELPIVSIQVSGGRMRATTAAIQVVPTDQVMALEARTLIHVFSYDDRSHSDVVEDRYVVMFMGEFVAYRFAKRAQGSRAVVLMCQDFTSYWDDAKMYFRDGRAMEGEEASDSGVTAGVKAAAFAGAHVTEKAGGLGAAAAELYQILEGDAVSAPGVKGLMAGILHLLESVGGISVGKKRFRGINDFFTQAELRLRLSQLVGVSAADDTSARLLQGSEFRRWLKYGLQQANRMISFRQVAELLLKRIYHQYTTISSPYLSPQRDVWSERRVPVGKTSADKLPPRYAQIARERIAILQSHIDSIQAAREADAAARRAARAAMYAGGAVPAVGSAQTDLLTGRAPVPVLREQIPSTGSTAGIGSGEGHEGGVDPLCREVQSAAQAVPSSTTKVALRRFEQAVSLDGERDVRAQRRKEALTTGAGGAFTSAESRDVDAAEKDAIETKAEYEKALHGAASYKTLREKRRLVSRLMLTVFSPDPWYLPPPRANVVLPDAYTTFQFDRNYRTDATRLQLETRAEHRTEEERADGERPKKLTHWAPDLEDVHGTLAHLSAEKGAHFIMDHEIFSGIVPLKLAVPDIDGFAQSDSSCKVKNLAYLQRLANYLLFKMRFAGRTGALHMPLNLDIVGGMPGVIFDQIRPDSVEEALGLEPVQYLAMFDTYEHTGDQTGGSTVVRVSHVRTQREQADLIGGPYEITVSDGTETVTKKYLTTAKMQLEDPFNEGRYGSVPSHAEQSSDLWAPVGVYRRDPEWRGSAEVYLGTDAQVPVVIQVKGDYNEDQTPSSYVVDDSGTGVRVTSIRPVEAGPRTLGALQDSVQDASLALQRLSGFRSAVVRDRVEVTLTRTRLKTKQVALDDVPFEEVVRPPWAADVYRNDRIGQFYQEMFGCYAITDPLGSEIGPVASLPNITAPSPGTSLPCIPQAEKATAAAAAAGDRVLSLLNGERSIAQAVDKITVAYRSVRGTGQEQVFIDQLTRRPIATLRDILGKDFDVASVSFVPDVQTGPGAVASGIPQAEEPIMLGEEGFHSRACGPYDGLALLAPGAERELDGSAAIQTVDARLDPRKRRYDRVVAYQLALRGRGGLLG